MINSSSRSNCSSSKILLSFLLDGERNATGHHSFNHSGQIYLLWQQLTSCNTGRPKDNWWQLICSISYPHEIN
jgi:hypothetical protein